LSIAHAAFDGPRAGISIVLIALIFATSGMLHLVKPAPFVSIMPPWLPGALALVLISGVFEIAGAMGILVPYTRVAAGWGLIALLFAVFPANVQMLLNARAAHASALWMAGLWGRLPLQVALIIWVYRSTIRVSA
jgi:uncharacterized membrane protein